MSQCTTYTYEHFDHLHWIVLILLGGWGGGRILNYAASVLKQDVNLQSAKKNAHDINRTPQNTRVFLVSY